MRHSSKILFLLKIFNPAHGVTLKSKRLYRPDGNKNKTPVKPTMESDRQCDTIYTINTTLIHHSKAIEEFHMVGDANIHPHNTTGCGLPMEEMYWNKPS